MSYKNFYDYKNIKKEKTYKFVIGKKRKGWDYSKLLFQLKMFHVKH